MRTKESLGNAINNVLSYIAKEKEKERVDIPLFVQSCIKEFHILDLPFYSVAVDPEDKTLIKIEVPFLKNCYIRLEQYSFGSKEKAATLYINQKPVRKVKLEETNSEYMTMVAHGLLDFLKRYLLVRNKFSR